MRLLLLSFLAVGCVPKAQYLEMEARYQMSVDEGATLQAEIARLESEINTLRSRAMVLDTDARRLRDQLAIANSEKAAILGEKADLQASVEQMEQALNELARRQATAERRLAAYKDLLARFQKLIDAGRLRVKISDGQMVVELPTDILFDSGSASLSEDGEAAIEEVGEVLASIPERRYQVSGHTDDVPIATAQYPSNWELASARALTVVKELIAAGVLPERVSGASFGETQPLASNETKEGRAQNRRIEILVVPDLSDLPGYDELTGAVSESDDDGDGD